MQQLKLRLMARGMRVDASAREAWHERFPGPMTLAEYATTSGIAIELPGELYVNAPPSDASDVPLFGHGREGFFVRDRERTVAVRALPVPAYHASTVTDQVTGAATRMTSFGVTHTDRVRVSPIEGCAWRCKFCDLPYEFKYRKRDARNLLDVILAAREDPQLPARHVLISGGTPRAPIAARPGRAAQDDEAWIDGVFELLASESPLPVDVMMPPRRDLRHPAWLQSVGIAGVSINLEVSDPERARRLAPAKAAVGREHTLDYIEAAVEAFGVGLVQSLVVFGSAIEPLESTLRGVRDLVERGCIPVLSAFRPDAATPLGGAPPASYEEMVEAYLRTREICAEYDDLVLPGPRCVACHHNTVSLPEQSEFFVGRHETVTCQGS